MNNNSSKDKILETASATTSKERSKSGNWVYITTICVLVVLISATNSCISGVTNTLNDTLNAEITNPHGLNLDNLDINLDPKNLVAPKTIDEFKKFLKEDLDLDEEDLTKSLTRSQALEQDLDIYNNNISSYVGAINYSGASSDMRHYVYNISKTDSLYSDTITKQLRLSQLESSDINLELSQAIEACDNAVVAINNISVPSSLSTKEKASVDNAKWFLEQRYKYVRQILTTIKDSNKISYAKLKKDDLAVKYSTQLAGQLLCDALTQSSNNK